MNIERDLQREIDALLDDIDSGMADKSIFVSDCRAIAKSYGVGYGYILARVKDANEKRSHL